MPITIGKVYGIPILLDYSWFIIFFLIAFTVGFVSIPVAYPNLSLIEDLVIGVVSAILLFVSILVHELAHSILAKRNGLNIKQITLFLFGGVSEIEETSINPSLELRVAAVGPLTSVVIAVIAFLAWYASQVENLTPLITAPLQYTAFVNGIVAAFNLIPAFPMDGGRILRSVLWSRNNDIMRATRTASTVGRGFAYALMISGIGLVVFGFFVDGLWFVLIGWFISNASKSALAYTAVQEDLRKLRAFELMTRNVDSVSPETSLEELSQTAFQRKQSGFPVLSRGELVGYVSNDDLKRVKRELWTTTRAEEIMVRREKLVTMKGYEVAEKAFTMMNSNKTDKIFVVDDKNLLLGIITRSDIIRVVQMEESAKDTRGEKYAIGADGKTITVQQGMLFILEQPAQGETDWTASYDQSKFLLVGERLVGSTKSFTFEALGKGSFSITLNFSSTQISERNNQPRLVQKAVKFNIIVS